MKILCLFIAGIAISIPCFSQNTWQDVAAINGLEVSVDTLSIKREGEFIYAQVKTAYTTDSTKNAYTDKIRRVYGQGRNGEKKLKKWEDFGYSISSRMYDCANKRFKVLEITDYTSGDKKIVSTKTPEKHRRWLPVGIETMGDYTLYYICDF
ncbi:MAG: hypothetical protein LBR34_04595 [Prevotella sp.]|nr:hypothetical protein [Prevotella sp.]